MYKSVFVLIISVGVRLTSAQAVTQNSGPRQATYIMDEEVKAVLKGTPPTDQQLKVIDTGGYNVGVGVLHRGKIAARPDGSVAGIAHHKITETYVVISGGGVLATGGMIEGGAESAPDGEITRILAGPSVSGTVKSGFVTRTVKPGDIVVIPPDVFHGWAQVDDHVDYLSVRPDPGRVLPAGYIHPAIKK